MTTLTKEMLDRLEALLAKATPGEWQIAKNDRFWVELPGDKSGAGWRENRDNDAAFIVEMHNASAALIAAARSGIAEGWRPIETAPRDGTLIVVWWCGQMHVASWRPVWHPDNPKWTVSHPRDPDSPIGPITDLSNRPEPTHWMPPPPPPGEAQAKQEED